MLRSARALAFVLAASGVAAGLGCGARYVRVPLREAPDLMVALRSQVSGHEPVARGFSHPATISTLRASHVLSAISIRESRSGEAGEVRPAIPSELLHELGGVLAEALAKADPTQEVVVRAKRRERKLAVFSRTFATSFVAFVDGEGRLQIHLADADRELPAGEEGALPEPIAGRSLHAFKVLPGPGIAALGQRSVAIDWRADTFRAPASPTAGRRRTILMDSGGAAQGELPVAEGALPTDPDKLRALDELEAERRAGSISEVEYQRRRAALLGPAKD